MRAITVLMTAVLMAFPLSGAGIAGQGALSGGERITARTTAGTHAGAGVSGTAAAVVRSEPDSPPPLLRIRRAVRR